MNYKNMFHIFITSTFTAEPIKDYIDFWIDKLSLQSDVLFSSYNQVYQQLLDSNSSLNQNHYGINVVLLRIKDWLRFKFKNEEINEDSYDYLLTNASNLIQAVRFSVSKNNSPLLLVLCPDDNKDDSSLENKDTRLDLIEQKIIADLNDLNSVYIITSSEIFAKYPTDDYYDLESDLLGHIPYTPKFYAALGTIVARKIFVLKSIPYKVIVLDLDNTVWSGICGEAGLNGVMIDPARQAFQELIIKQYQLGVLICLCSKNNEEDALAVFNHNNNMILNLDHVVSWRINWERKSENIKSLAEELNLGLDSFIFIDDNPVECAEVSLNCPEVLTLNFPLDEENIYHFIEHTWVFDRLYATSEDSRRTQLYRENIAREKFKNDASSFDEFLSSLELEVNIFEVSSESLSRVSQLTHRTNQFNFTTIRRTESEILEFSKVCSNHAYAVEVRDRFGDYGLVGVLLFSLTDQLLNVDTFLLSCRVLGRNIEYRMLSFLAIFAEHNGLSNVRAIFLRTNKNQPAFDFLQKVKSKTEYSNNDSVTFLWSTQDLLDISTNKVSPKNDEDCNTAINLNRTNGEVEKNEKIESKSVASTSFSTHDKASVLHEIYLDLYSSEKVLAKVDEKYFDHDFANNELYAQPRTDTQVKLTAIFSEVLRLKTIGIEDDFFSLGGTSLLAVRLFSRINTVFGKDLPLSILFETPTIKTLAQILDEENTETLSSSLVPIQTSGSKVPLFGVHGAYGNVLYYAPLSQVLAENYPFYGLRPMGLKDNNLPLNSIEDMASYYISLLRKVQPNGPYYLCGRCLGSLIAYEMAIQLQSVGQTIAFLGLIDPTFLKSSNPFHYTVLRFLYYYRHSQLYTFVRHFRSYIKSILISSRLFPSFQVNPKHTHNTDNTQFVDITLKDLILDLANFKNLFYDFNHTYRDKSRVFEANIKAQKAYSAKAKFKGNAYLYLASSDDSKSQYDVQSWCDLIANEVFISNISSSKKDILSSEEFLARISLDLENVYQANIENKQYSDV